MLSVFSHHEIAYQNCFEIASYTFGNGWDHFPLSLDSLVPKEKVWEHGKTLTFTKAMWIHSLFLNGFHLILSFHVLFTIFNIIYISVLYGTLSTSFWIPCALFLHFHPAKMQWLGDAKSLTVHSNVFVFVTSYAASSFWAYTHTRKAIGFKIAIPFTKHLNNEASVIWLIKPHEKSIVHIHK